MNIIEVKNNLVKLSYDENVTLASFIKITDLKNSYIAQISHLESSRIGKIAIARLLFNFKNGIQAYDGSVPSIQAEIEILSNDFFVNCLDKTEPLFVGKINSSDTDVIVSANLLKDKPIICAEKTHQAKLLIENLIYQNKINNRKTVVFDTTGEISGDKITATKDFKLPLNRYSIDYIFDRGFDDLTPENKAFIQDIFSELNDYIKTVEYIPFNDFNSVIEYEFKRTQKLQLIILKNRLTQFEKKGIFANEVKDFKILNEKLDKNNELIIDISRLDDGLQTEYIEYVYSQMENHNTNFYSVLMLNNNNSSAALLNRAFGTKNIFTSIVCPYSYKYLKELKQCSKNMFMFTPIKQQSDFGTYNIFLNRLAEDEFILYGKSTKFTPIIIKGVEVEQSGSVPDFPAVIESEIDTMDFDTSELVVNDRVEPETPETLEDEAEIDTPEIEIIEDIEEVESEPESEQKQETIEESEQEQEPVIEQEIESEPEQIEEVQTEVEPETPAETAETVETQLEPETTEPETEIIGSESESMTAETETDDIQEEVPTEEQPISFADTFADISIDIDNEDLKNAISDRNEINDLLAQIQQTDPNTKPINDMVQLQTVDSSSVVDDVENDEDDDSELTDEDLDMIESLDAQMSEEAGDTNRPEGVNSRVETDTPTLNAPVGVNSEGGIEPAELKAAPEGVNSGVEAESTALNTPAAEAIEPDVSDVQNSETVLTEDTGIITEPIPVTEDNEEDTQTVIEDYVPPVEDKVQEEQTEPQEKKHQSITDEILEEEARRRAEEEASKPDPIEEQIEKPSAPQKPETLETKAGSTPIVPVYSAEIPDEDIVESDNLEQGDQIMHAEFGRGIVEKIINYGERKLCSVNFEQVGRRLLDPKVSEMKKV